MKIRILITALIGFSLLQGCGPSSQSASETQDVGDILSSQLREDGNYDVICKSGVHEVVTAEQIKAGEVCNPPPPPPVAIRAGYYVVYAGDTNYCDQSVTPNYEGQTLVSVTMSWVGSCSGISNTYACDGALCETTYGGKTIKVEIEGPETYRYWGLGSSWGSFKWARESVQDEVTGERNSDR
jgi:hypothetical protein